MATPTYTPLANLTLGASAASITFGSIPATYRDLILVVQGTTTVTADARLRINGDTGAGYDHQRMSGNGSAATAASASLSSGSRLTEIVQFRSTDLTQLIINIMDYSATDKHKTILSRADRAGGGAEAHVNRWPNTAAITNLVLYTAASWQSGTTVALYGIVS
jgi:hypothetical protein